MVEQWTENPCVPGSKGPGSNFNGTTNILGVMAIHQGTNGTSSMNASYKIYDVGINGLPGSELASKSIPYNDIPVDGTSNTSYVYKSSASLCRFFCFV